MYGVPAPGDPLHGLYALLWFFEKPLLVAGIVLTLVGLWRFLPLGRHRLFAKHPNPALAATRLAILFSVPLFWIVLSAGAASDILGFYTFLYAFLAAACFLWGAFRFPVLRMYLPADVVERRNPAAGLALGGFALGTGFAFAGALIGEGPGWFVVVVFFLLAYGELRASLAFVDRYGGFLAREARLDRDVSAGLLLGAVATASGLIAGRAAAGDFHGWIPAMTDYLMRLWLLLPIALAGVLVGLSSQKTPRFRTHIRILGGVILVAATLAYATTTCPGFRC